MILGRCTWQWLFRHRVSAGRVCLILAEIRFSIVFLDNLMSKYIDHAQLLSIAHGFKNADRWEKIFNSAERKKKKKFSSSLNLWTQAEFSNHALTQLSLFSVASFVLGEDPLISDSSMSLLNPVDCVLQCMSSYKLYDGTKWFRTQSDKLWSSQR